MPSSNLSHLKQDFPILGQTVHGDKPLTYLDSGASSQKPRAVIEAISRYYDSENANIHRGVYQLSVKATEAFESARQKVAYLIGAKFTETIFTRGTTESLNLLAYNLPAIVPAGRNRIVLTEMEHHANLVPWQQLARRQGWEIDFIPLTADYQLDMTKAEALLTDQVAILAFPHVSNVLGTVNEAKILCKWAREQGALSVIDAAQSVPHMPVNVKALDCDFLAFSAHKMCGPTGIGVLYGREEALLQLPPFLFGGDMIREVSYQSASWADLPEKFEAGTPHIAGAIGLGVAVDYLNAIGLDKIEAWEKQLTTYALEKLSIIEGIKLFHPGVDNGSGIISFEIEGIHPHDLGSLLDDEGICIRAGHHCAMPLMGKLGVSATVRVSFYLYNDKPDVDRFIQALEKAILVFR